MKLAFANRHNLSEAVHPGDAEAAVVLFIDLASDVVGCRDEMASHARSILLSDN